MLVYVKMKPKDGMISIMCGKELLMLVYTEDRHKMLE